jgi:lipopolysaccharide transport system permease protein
VLPVSAVIGGLVDFVIAFALLVILLVAYGAKPTAAVILLPLFLLLAMMTALALGLWLSALNVQYRDVNNALPFFTQLLMFISPVAYPASVIPEKWQLVYALNPMATVINGFRWALLEGQPSPGLHSLVSIGVVFVALVGGLYFFRWQEDRFADVV